MEVLLIIGCWGAPAPYQEKGIRKELDRRGIVLRRIFGFFAGLLALSMAATPAMAQHVCDRSPQDVSREIVPSIVSILAVSIDPFSLVERLHTVVGSGIVIDDAGHVLTNSHLVFGSSSIAVTTSRQEVFVAELVGADPVLDLAVLRLPVTAHSLSAAMLGDSDALEIGQDTLAVGNAFGMGLAVTRGIVSGLNRVVRRSPMSWLAPLIQTDAAINAGSSGGPLVNLCGEVIGINTFRLEQGAGVGFSVPINVAKEAIPQLIQDGRIKRPWHGVNGKIVELPLQMLLRVPLVRGFLVETVEPGSAAAEIGLRGGSFPVRVGAAEYLLGGDIITRVNGKPLTDLQAAVDIVGSLEVGGNVTIEYFREGKTYSAEVVLSERPILPSDLTGVRARQVDYQRRSGERR